MGGASIGFAKRFSANPGTYYKWLSPRPLTARRERPVEYARRTGQLASLPVLFDHPDELIPTITKCPTVDPGTPRHPAYPSGHSTYAGAASAFLRFFFGNDPIPPALRATPGDPNAFTIGRELDNLADNIGLGRMWAGIHWRTDHTAGLTLGRTVARLVLEQLFATGNLRLCVPQPIPPNQCKQIMPMCNEAPPPSIQVLEGRRDSFVNQCDNVVPQQPCPAPTPTAQALEDLGRTPEQIDRERQQTYSSLQTFVEIDQTLLDSGRSPQEGGLEGGQAPDRQP